MKKYLILLLALCSFSTMANHELSTSYLKINQNLFDTIAFPMDAVEVSYSYLTGYNVGARIGLGRSVETANSLYVEGLHYSNKINLMTTGEIFYRYNYSPKMSFDIGVGKTDYTSTWKVNGKVPSWGDNSTDSDWSYHFRSNWSIDSNIDLTIGYSDIYRKYKEDYGREETKYWKVGLTYKF